jgi:hypothetical protein
MLNKRMISLKHILRIINPFQRSKLLQSPRLIPIHRLQRLIITRVVLIDVPLVIPGSFPVLIHPVLSEVIDHLADTRVGVVERDNLENIDMISVCVRGAIFRMSFDALGTEDFPELA